MHGDGSGFFRSLLKRNQPVRRLACTDPFVEQIRADLCLEADDDGTDFGYGAGVSLILGKIEVRAEYEIVEFDDADMDIVSLGAAWRF